MITNKLIVEIKSKINDNQKQGITGGILQGVLLDMVESLSEAYPQIYTEEQKAQARANIDALSDYDGAITKEKLSAEVQAILDDVANKQNITDESLATIAKTIVGAINELFNGGLKDASIATSKIKDNAISSSKIDDGAVSSDKIADGAVISTKLSGFLQDKVKMVGMNVKVLPDGTDLLSEDLEEGIYVVDCSKMTNVPSSITKSAYDYALSLLIVDREHKRVMLFGLDNNSTKYPTCAYRHLVQKSWNNTPKSIFSELSSLQLSVIDKQNKQDTTLETTSKEVVGAINELFNGGVKDKSIETGKLAQAVQDTLGKVGMNVKEVKSGEDLFSLEDGIYSLNGSTYTNYPIGIPFDTSAVCILVVTHSNQRVTLYGVDGSHSSPILPLVAIGDLENKIWRGGSFYSFFASDYEVGHKLDQKLDNTSTLTDTEVNNIWDNN